MTWRAMLAAWLRRAADELDPCDVTSLCLCEGCGACDRSNLNNPCQSCWRVARPGFAECDACVEYAGALNVNALAFHSHEAVERCGPSCPAYRPS